MNITVTKPQWTIGADGARVSLIVPTPADARMICDLFNDGKQYEMDVHAKRRKRSKNANDLLWEMCTRIAEKMSQRGDYVTKNEIYQNYIRSVGTFEDVAVPEQAAKRLMDSWSNNGVGWVSEKVDFIPGKEITGAVKIRLYYGSSTYDTTEMSRLLNAVMQDAAALGIDTLSESDRALLAQYPWGQ